MNQAHHLAITPGAVASARADLQRLNGELAELHKEEQRCQLLRSRLEAERTRVLAFIDMGELAQRYSVAAQPGDGLTVRIMPVDEAKPNGVKVVTVNGDCGAGEPLPQDELDEAPTLREMVVMALEDAVMHGRRGLKASAVIDFVLRHSEPDVPRSTVSSAMWRMAQDGEIEKHGRRYRLVNGHA